jgi:hypothetical protein
MATFWGFKVARSSFQGQEKANLGQGRQGRQSHLKVGSRSGQGRSRSGQGRSRSGQGRVKVRSNFKVQSQSQVKVKSKSGQVKSKSSQSQVRVKSESGQSHIKASEPKI